MLTREEIAIQILAGMCANPTETHVQGVIAIKNAFDLTEDFLIEAQKRRNREDNA